MKKPSIYLTSFICIILLSTLSGCAQKYLVPEGIPQATLITSVDFGGHPGVIRMQAFENEKCDRTSIGNRLATFNSSGTVGPLKNVKTSVVANKELVFTLAYAYGVITITDTASCIITNSFTPLPGHVYRLNYSISENSCHIQTLEVSTDGTVFPIADLRQIKPICYNVIDG